MPKEISHSWLEVEIDEQWCQVDTYINDIKLHSAAVKKLKHIGWETGYSISIAGGEPAQISPWVKNNIRKWEQSSGITEPGTSRLHISMDRII